jgi:acyl carrier protein
MIFEKVVKILKDYKDLGDIEITPQTTFAELEFDSLDTVELVMYFEDEFGVTLETDDSIKTVGDVIELIEQAQ